MDGYSVPEISESAASGSLKAIYADIRHVLKVHVVNVLFRTLAWYEKFLAIGWKQIRPNMLTLEGKRAAEALRYPNLNVQMPKVDWNRYYDQSTLERIRASVFIFNYVNTKLLLIASSWSESLGNRPNSGKQQVQGMIEPGILPGLPTVQLMRIPEAPSPVRTLLQDIAKVHHHYEVASDYRALAYYPQFLQVSWRHLRDYIDSKEYIALRERLKSKSIQLTKGFPYPITVNRNMLESHYGPQKLSALWELYPCFKAYFLN